MVAQPDVPAIERGQGQAMDRLLSTIPLRLSVLLGGAMMTVKEVSALREGAMVILDRKIGDPVDVLINERVVARGEIGVSSGDQPHFVIKLVEFVDGKRQGAAPDDRS